MTTHKLQIKNYTKVEVIPYTVQIDNYKIQTGKMCNIQIGI